MPRPWTLIDAVETPEGPLELRQRGARDFLISVGGRVLMSTTHHRSEVAVAQLGVEPVADREAPRVLIGGLGLGYTLRAALDALPKGAQVVVAELNPAVVRWCQGPAAAASGDAVSAPGVQVRVGDVTACIREASRDRRRRLDAIILDLYEGPSDGPDAYRHPLYGAAILGEVVRALTPGGCFAVWGEDPAPGFEARMRKAGLASELVRVRGGGPRHAVYRGVKRRA